MTAHLESLKECSEKRMDQLKYCFKSMLEQDENSFVFFGGDLNLRDSEVFFFGNFVKGTIFVLSF
jgi:hypothetical protein